MRHDTLMELASRRADTGGSTRADAREVLKVLTALRDELVEREKLLQAKLEGLELAMKLMEEARREAA